jgi:hypothetical protein
VKDCRDRIADFYVRFEAMHEASVSTVAELEARLLLPTFKEYKYDYKRLIQQATEVAKIIKDST